MCKWQRISKFTKGVGHYRRGGGGDVLIAGVRHLCAGQAASIHCEGAEKCRHYLQEQGYQQDLDTGGVVFVILSGNIMCIG